MRVQNRVLAIRRWWDEPDRFDATTEFLRQRGMLRSAQIVMTVVAASAMLVAVSFLLEPPAATPTMMFLGSFGTLFTTGMAVFWWRSWPTRRQSQLALVGGTTIFATWSVAQPFTAVAVLGATATAVTGGYVAFFHGNRLLVFNFAVAIATSVLTTRRLDGETNTATAVAAFWLIWFLNMSVPLVIAAMTRAMSTYAMRSDVDPLTGLLNRRGFADVTGRLARAPGAATHLSVLMVDLDNFKLVNDTHGHAEGGRARRAVAHLLRERSPPGATVCRAGGEEFLIALTARPESVPGIATPLCRAIAELPHHITASIGTGSAELHRHEGRSAAAALVDALVVAADTAMYTAKRKGGNQVEFS